MGLVTPVTEKENFEAAGVASAASSGARPFASFIVCTRDRVKLLVACIRSIETTCLAHPAIASELIVVDNGSTDGTHAELRRIARASKVPMTLVPEPRQGLAVARNAGMERARGRVFVFIDDDCVVDRAYLGDLKRHYASGDGVIRGGRVELGNPHDLPFTIKRSKAAARLTPDVHPGGFVLGCNMTMDREVALRVGCFDERFGVGAPLCSAEDTEYLVRAYALGIPVEYVPDMTVFHHHGRRARAAIEKLHRSYSLGNGALCLKHLVKAPWLVKHFFWTVRSACLETLGGARFDPALRLSHWPVVAMNLLGAARFVRLCIVSRAAPTALQPISEATPKVERGP